MPYYPVMLDLKDLPCLVVGGGQVAERKVEALMECQADVTVISPQVTAKLGQLHEQGIVRLIKRSFSPGDSRGYHLVITAVNEPDVNNQVGRECRQARIPVNVVDDPENCTFFVPAVIRRGDLVIAVSTGGASPLAARKIREELGERYGEEYGEYLRILAEARETVKQKFPEAKRRREIFTELADGKLLNMVQAGRLDEAKEWVKQCLS